MKQARLGMCALAAALVATACFVSDSPLQVEVDEPPQGESGEDGRSAPVRGIYVSAHAAGSSVRLARLLRLADNSAVNAFVIDVKENGEVTYASSVPLVADVGAGREYIGDLPALLRTLRDYGIRPIARIVCFRDPVLAEARPEWAVRTKRGDLWIDPETGGPWVDPYNEEAWAYNIAIAREALEAGFAEIQWDYVRFPDVTDAVRAGLVFPAQRGRSRANTIRDFVSTSRRELAGFDAAITAGVFGRVITEVGGSGIGQDWNRLVPVTDVILPMVYPAAYWPGNFGLPDPNAEPYRLVRAAMDSAVARMHRTDGALATIRPWLQAFTLGGTIYGAEQMADQIRAVEDAGLQEWLFWNAASVYPEGVF